MDPIKQKLGAQSTKTDTMQPKIEIPGYKILRELGHGGMAHVYLAVQESFGRQVALKVLSPHLADDEQFSKRFLREARIVSQLHHPNIVTVFDAGKQGQYHYMSMEYIPGKDVKQLKDSISREEAIRIVKDVASALDFVGKKGIVHRDVKPENIMIHQSDNRVILMDFGIAHGDDVTQGMTQTGKAIGTPHFMSPEQTKGLKVDHRSDIYSLGVVLFQLLAHHLPFDADSAVAVGIKHLTAPIPLLPGGLEIFQPIINHCLSKQPQHRYQKAAELIDALNNISAEQLESINTQAKVFIKAGADHNAETQMSDIVISQRRKIPDLVFPSGNRTTVNQAPKEVVKTGTRRRNLLFLLLILTLAWGAIEKQKELTHFWAYKALPEIVNVFPDLFPKSYIQFWAKKLEDTRPKITAIPTVVTATPKLPVELGTTDQLTAIEEKATLQQDTVTIKETAEVDRLTQLINGLDDNPKNAIELTKIYKDLLLEDKKNTAARQGLKSLREWYIKKIGIAFATEDAVLARQHIDIMKQNFPRATTNKRFVRLEKKIAFLERLNDHLEKAEKYFNAGALSKPINQNALDEVNTVLRLSPSNEEAKNFKTRIVNAYLEKTTQLQKQGNIHNAILMVEEGIAALNNNPVLVNKRKKLKDEIKHNKNISALFKKATKYILADQLIKPGAYNAYDIYQEILKQDSGNLQAQAGLKNIHQQLAKKITAAIQKGNLKISEEYLQAAIQRYGRSSLLASVQLKLNDALDALAPKIETLLLSATPLTRLITNKAPAKNIETLALKQTLYIGFNFINFDIGTTWLDLILIDKTKNIIVAQKPVVISSQFGEHFFDVNIPVKGFENHQYKIELRLKNKILKSKLFSVQY